MISQEGYGMEAGAISHYLCTSIRGGMSQKILILLRFGKSTYQIGAYLVIVVTKKTIVICAVCSSNVTKLKQSG